jgi:hypothetical protein
MRRIGNIGRGVFAATILGALGVGASGAMAMPAEKGAAFCTVQTLPQCKADCIAAGARTGTCSAGECECLW